MAIYHDHAAATLISIALRNVRTRRGVSSVMAKTFLAGLRLVARRRVTSSSLSGQSQPSTAATLSPRGAATGSVERSAGMARAGVSRAEFLEAAKCRGETRMPSSPVVLRAAIPGCEQRRSDKQP